MLLFSLGSTLVAVLSIAAASSGFDYSLTRAQMVAVSSLPHAPDVQGRFASPSQAAYAAARAYRLIGLDESVEVAAKIYLDPVLGTYGFGPLMRGSYDPFTEVKYVTYTLDDIDKHFGVIGLWHAHGRTEEVESLFGHEEFVAATHLAVWTTVGRDLYVQYWDGRAVAPQWSHLSVPALPALCRQCLQ